MNVEITAEFYRDLSKINKCAVRWAPGKPSQKLEPQLKRATEGNGNILWYVDENETLEV